MIKYTVAKIKDYTEETVPQSTDDIIFEKPLVLNYVDNVSRDRIFSDYCKHWQLKGSQNIIILTHTENQSRDLADAILYKLLGNTFDQKKLTTISKMFGHTVHYILDMPESLCDKIIPSNYMIVRNVHEVEAWVPDRE